MRPLTILIVALIFLGASVPTHACSVCQGDPNSSMVKGAQGGVVVMIIVVYGVLMLFGAMVAVCFVRYRRLTRTGQSAPLTPRPPVEHPDD